ncbi:MAG: hypothetical protein A2231_02560 [Candidatus Firestonebacteria bacterium RIFOXYA2_FULL_40_8]|nr:MAG: hypothetical protein A2231_02560 [Candidatus Firestonebacteria bacterium RIFOXYA2_FULL_40_8]
MLTKGQIEGQISEAIIKFEKEYMGRGPVETRTFIIEDLVVVRLKGVLTPAEEQLTKTKDGAELIKRTRALLIEEGKTLLSEMINKITGIKVISLHTDVSTKTGERIIVFTLEKKFE